MRLSKRRGFALLAVLWIMTGVAALGLALSLAGRSAVATARNRMELTRAAWRAEDCLERTRAAIAVRLTEAPVQGGGAPETWLRLDDVIEQSPLVAPCGDAVALSPAGMALDINAASDEQLRRLLRYQGIAEAQADSMVDALLDWRDRDDTPRPNGAERDWYEVHDRPPPRNGPFASVREIERVRGFETWSVESDSARRDALSFLFTVERGRVVLDRAPLQVLAAMPGFTDETLARVEERRLRGAPPLSELLALGGELSPISRDSLHRRYAELVGLVTLEPDAWILTARSAPDFVGDAAPSLVATIETRLVRAGSRAAIVRRRTWP